MASHFQRLAATLHVACLIMKALLDTEPAVQEPRNLEDCHSSTFLGFFCLQLSRTDCVKNFAVIYLVDITEVPDFNKMYELYDPCTVMFFFRNKHIMIDLGTGNNNKINWAMEDKQEMVDIIETVYRGARKGRGLVVSPKDYSTKHKLSYDVLPLTGDPTAASSRWHTTLNT
ncbi:hypothetical protein STEG23_000505 [Scotinomys teguina]